MSCETYEPMIQADIDGELTPTEAAELKGHISACPACAEASAELTVLAERLVAVHTQHAQVQVEVNIPGVPAVSAPAPVSTTPGPLAAPTPQSAQAPTVLANPLESGTGRIGKRIGGYEIEHRIAKGGMGSVYRARQISMDRPVALKVLSPEFTENEQFVARFLREARLAATVSHPNLVQIYEVGQEGSGSGLQLYYSMELVEGKDLEQILSEQGSLAPKEVTRIGVEVARALAGAAEQGIVHRDIKPANILLTGDGSVKLADLGLAKALESGDSSVTMRKTVIGSPNYMSPEQAQDIRLADARSDIYSLAATLLHLMTGEIPYGRGAPIEILAKVLRDPLTVPDVVAGEAVDAELKQVLERALEKEPLVRQASAQELVADLSRCLSSARSSSSGAVSGSGVVRGKSKRAVRRSNRIRRGSSDSRVARHSSEGRVGASSGTGRHGPPPILWVAAAAAVLAVIGLIAFGGKKPKLQEPEVAASSSPAPKIRKEPSLKTLGTPKPDKAKSKAAKELAYLIQFGEENPDLVGERYRKAAAFLSTYPTATQATRARELRDGAGERLKELLAKTEASSKALEAEGKLWGAREAYAAFLKEHGEGVPGRPVALIAMKGLDLQLKTRLDEDLAEVEGLLKKGDGAGAGLLLAKIDRYAGPELRLRDRDAHSETVAQLTKPQDPVAPKDDVEALLARSRMLLNQARTLLTQGKKKQAAEVLAKLQALEGYAKLTPALREEAELLAKRSSSGAEPPTPTPQPGTPKLSDGELLAMVSRGKVRELEGGRVEIAYDFKDPAQVEDWTARKGPVNQWEKRFDDWLAKRSKPRGKMPAKPFQLHKNRMLAYGQERGVLFASWDTSAELRVDVEARGKQNLLIAFGREKPLVAGVGYQLNPLPLNQLAPWMRQGGDRAKKWFGEIERQLARSRQRGPSVAVLYEEGPMRFEELHAQRAKLRSKVKFSVVLSREDEGHTVEVFVGKRSAAEVEAKAHKTVQVSLVTYGAVVAYDAIRVEGKPSKDFLEKLRRAHRRATKTPPKGREALEKAVREAFQGQQKKDREAREKEREKEAERRRRERERNRDKDD